MMHYVRHMCHHVVCLSTNFLEAAMSYSIPRAACFTARRVPIFRQRSVRVYSEIKSPMDKPGGKVTKKDQLLDAKKKVEEIITSSKCNPILVRLAWHDSGTFVSLTGLCRAQHMLSHALQEFIH